MAAALLTADAAMGVVAQALCEPGGGGVSAEARGACCALPGAPPATGLMPDLDPVPGFMAAGSSAWRLALGVGNSILSGRLLWDDPGAGFGWGRCCQGMCRLNAATAERTCAALL